MSELWRQAGMRNDIAPQEVSQKVLIAMPWLSLQDVNPSSSPREERGGGYGGKNERGEFAPVDFITLCEFIQADSLPALWSNKFGDEWFLLIPYVCSSFSIEKIC